MTNTTISFRRLYSGLFSFSLFVLLTPCLQAQEPWSLEKCILYAQENNIQIKVQQLSVESNKAYLNQTYGSILPNLGASAGLGFSNGRSGNTLTYTFTNSQTTANFGLGGNFGLFNGLQKYYTIQQNRLNIQAALQDVEKSKNDISLNVAASYLQILYYNELVKVSSIQVELTKIQVDRIQKLVKAGSLPEGNLYEIKAQLAQDELQLLDAQNNQTITKLTLSQLLELKDASNFTIVEPNITIPADTLMLENVNTIFNEALNVLPEFKSYDLKLKSSQYSIKAAKSSYYPSLSSYYNLNTGYSNTRKIYDVDPLTNQQIEKPYPFNNQFTDNAYLSYGFSLSIPIFSNFRLKTNVALAKINARQTEYSLELIKKDVYKNIQQAFANSKNAQKKFIATSEAVKYNKEAFRYAQQKYENGALNTVDYNLAKTKLAKVEADLLQAKYDYMFRKKILEFYSGKPLSF